MSEQKYLMARRLLGVLENYPVTRQDLVNAQTYGAENPTIEFLSINLNFLDDLEKSHKLERTPGGMYVLPAEVKALHDLETQPRQRKAVSYRTRSLQSDIYTKLTDFDSYFPNNFDVLRNLNEQLKTDRKRTEYANMNPQTKISAYF